MKTLPLCCLLVLGACGSEPSTAPPAASVESEASAGADTAVRGTETSDDHAEPGDNAAPAVADANVAHNTDQPARGSAVAAVTPVDQKENQSDLKITQQIRQAVMADDSLSFAAKNAKIITQDGHVTLQGPVKTAAERTALFAHASHVAGGHVANQLEVEP